MADVTDATFQTAVVERSATVPIVVDLWAPWCGPCRQLGPILEAVIAQTAGQVELAKVNVDENPQVSQMFRVQGIPAVYALKGGQVVDGFTGAQGEPFVREFVARLLPTEEELTVEALIEAGDEASLRQALELEPGNEAAVLALSLLLVNSGRSDEALQLLARIPENDETRRIAALARTGQQATSEVEAKLEALLPSVKGNDDARQQFVDLLELLGPDNPATADYRRRLSSALY